MTIHDLDIILGVNDETQIKNDKLRTDYGKTLLVKPFVNNRLETLVDEECRELINESDLICLFGLSLGETDATWWETIGEHIKNTRAILIYFAFDDDKIRYNNELIDKRQAFRALLNKRLWGEASAKEWQDQLFVGYKTSLFR